MPPPPAQSQPQEFVHPDASHAKKKIPSAYAIKPISAFYCFLAAGIISAVFAPIQDCDETFNYYEPAHYLTHGYGFQTWEYDPKYAIRSWFYVGVHALVGSIRRILPQGTKLGEFYLIRYALAFVCALAQVLLYCCITLTLNARIGVLFLLATVLSAGNFHASTAFLPSSFAMYTGMLGAASFMNWRGGLKTSQGIAWFAAGAIFGWPFAGALCLPYLFEEGILAIMSDKERFIESLVRIGRGVVAAVLMVIFDVAVNAFFYREVVVVPWNIVKYNVLGGSGGPELYGTEPWTFYFRNLTLNFNIWFILALVSLPLFIIQKLVSPSGHGFQSGLRAIIFMSPFYLWFGIFTLQSHKEERFMYPAYPFLALNAAIAAHIVLTFVGQSDPKTLVAKIPAQLRLLAVTLTLILSFDIGLARVYGVYSAYSAPTAIYSPLNDGPNPLGVAGDTVCFGKEWYRFPTSYFLPRGMHAKFVRSEFKGLLPGEFSEANIGFGLFSGAWLPTSGMNDKNEEDPGKYTELRHCNFLVDTQYPLRTDPLPPNEPDYVADEENWEVAKCVPFLDAANTHTLARALWVPDLPFVPERLRRKWGQHCLLKRKK
ncbi:Alg9-like mannosyltransferase family-domain-containing protein [Plectosphaerella cucumerina]|uniref:Mannosyltransferase n=1 Tax=Plectosphaerella cucumerina TaxID=40658 RepID=A0A8K0T7R9_9PEZI|nr:Alg9-like mannosyltransferase family-domain-containing protein [Plectosphaerella cucumerina]